MTIFIDCDYEKIIGPNVVNFPVRNTNYYYIVESEILKNTQRDIFHIFTNEDIDHLTFSNLLLA
jgi:hypothetical protein